MDLKYKAEAVMIRHFDKKIYDKEVDKHLKKGFTILIQNTYKFILQQSIYTATLIKTTTQPCTITNG